MKITKKILKILECCDSGIFKFINTPELHNINDDVAVHPMRISFA